MTPRAATADGGTDPLVRVWPLFGLVITTPRLVLTPVRDEHLPELVDAVLDGIHDPAEMPFSFPWTDAPRDVLIPETARHQWKTRAGVGPDDWTINFAVLHRGRVIGVQDLMARRFPLLRRVGSGSWLTRSVQGQGLGTEMRAAVLQCAFDHLGATSAVSEAADWNRASLGVSRRLGYSLNGTALVEARRGEVQTQQNLLLAREDFRRPDWTAEVRGVEAVLDFLLPGRGPGWASGPSPVPAG
ncbi:GNAT family N-acetyltransferase [Arthrobacter sp. B0490]|uniref:GNAT family N-acetyltransferase n=1 Tax=Arthrobacter sp. B0490 TaxID=2058891 RepID=UPI0021585F28|nr:GNAT family N-acetyltransferase [Arthrobacter sp. B0490]